MGVSEDQRPEGEDVVDVAVPVDVEEVCTLPALDEDGGAADGTEGAHRGAHAARHQLLSLGEQALRGLVCHPATGERERTIESAAASPDAMQSGIPTPR